MGGEGNAHSSNGYRWEEHNCAVSEFAKIDLYRVMATTAQRLGKEITPVLSKRGQLIRGGDDAKIRLPAVFTSIYLPQATYPIK